MNGHFAHDTAIVDDGASIGAGTKIWHWTHICSGAKIGKNCSVGQNVFIANNVQIGNNARIQNNVSVYDNVHIEDDVFCGPSMVFTNVINPRAAIPRKDEFRNTHIRKGATLGANCTIICGVTIGCHAFIAAGAVVTREVHSYALVMGVPAKQSGWICICGQQLPQALNQEPSEVECRSCKKSYMLTTNSCTLASTVKK